MGSDTRDIKGRSDLLEPDAAIEREGSDTSVAPNPELSSSGFPQASQRESRSDPLTAQWFIHANPAHTQTSVLGELLRQGNATNYSPIGCSHKMDGAVGEVGFAIVLWIHGSIRIKISPTNRK